MERKQSVPGEMPDTIGHREQCERARDALVLAIESNAPTETARLLLSRKLIDAALKVAHADDAAQAAMHVDAVLSAARVMGIPVDFIPVMMSDAERLPPPERKTKARKPFWGFLHAR